MVRLRKALMALMFFALVVGCSHTHDYAHWSIFHCSECDDFPMPSYGPNATGAGTYSGPPPQGPSSASRMVTPPSSNAPVQSEEAIVAPPDERPTAPAAAEPPTTTTPTPPAPPSAGTP
jgi:hypothetical protein